jgi:lipopolysaccharide assembly outer membrane protein LptD (OstA)
LYSALSFALAVQAQTNDGMDVIAGDFYFSNRTEVAMFTNGVQITWSNSVLEADWAQVNTKTGDTVAEGRVRIQRDNQVFAGERIHYNFITKQMSAEQFRTGRPPIFAAGHGLHGDTTNHTYSATNGIVTTDDISDPIIHIRAHHIKIIPGKRIEATHAVLYVGEVPVFYFPYYSRNLGERANNFNFIPGYRSSYGPFLLTSYTWFLNKDLDGKLHVDYRVDRGIGVGPDVNYHFGPWGEGTFKYYYTHDNDPSTNGINSPLRNDRQRVYFSYQANPATNLNVKSLVRYQNDAGVVKDFFPGEYRQDPQPNTFVEVNKFWQNFSLDVLAQPRLNDFYETVERLPDVRLTGFRQQLWETPVYYQSESSVGYFQRLFAETNGAPSPNPNYAATRADTYHQLVLPETLFGWLNVTPRAGARFTYYSEASGPGATNFNAFDQGRAVFNTGAEVSFKASRLWPDVENKTFGIDGLRHIIEPSVNYVFVPRPNVRPNEIPQFDYVLASFGLLPIEFPEFNAIDSVDSEDTFRLGLRNKLQTKRNGQVVDYLDWEMFVDWRMRPLTNQQTFSDLYSDLVWRPLSWFTVQSQTRFGINNNQLNMSLVNLTFQPNNTWSWTVGHFYLRNDFDPTEPTALGPGNDLITSSMFFRVNENWGFRATHHYDVQGHRLQEQYYTLYRDFRAWTAALTAGVRENENGPRDLTVAFTFSLKAFPTFPLGHDTVRPYSLLGGGSSSEY